MKKTMKLMPLMRHKRSQNTGVLYTLVDEVLATLGAPMRISSRTEVTFGSVIRRRPSTPFNHLTQCFESRSKLRRKQLRLFPCGEVPAFGQSIVINELGIRFLCPATRGSVDLVGKGAL